MKKLTATAALLLVLAGLLSPHVSKCGQSFSQHGFLTISGHDLLTPDGKKFFIKGTNLGNWLNPEGYMFQLSKTSSARLIDNALRELVGPDFTNSFWKQFKDHYITRQDIRYIAKTGANSIRVPFHYKLFTHEDYMGLSTGQDGFTRLDSLVSWCRESGLYVILDMHDAPGGQTGDNIDDSYGYPWLFTSLESRQLFLKIWREIADHYKNEPVVLGYDLLNEPIAHYFKEDLPKLNAALEPLYKEAVAAIRTVDKNHLVLLGGAQWDGNFKVFHDSGFDKKMMYTCHRYWCDTLQANIQDFVHFRDSVNRPLYMGETGENNDKWVAAWTRLMVKNNIGYHYWPYKRMGNPSSMMHVVAPDDWKVIVDFAESSRTGFDQIRKARPDQEKAKKILLQYLENCKFENCIPNPNYTKAIGLNP
ncbi:MAG: glycoside hydrolase family 5 protein [Marinilabiliales bacterium]|nr:glycoside hydrolase family 5 protein [Marinilabiliales bacterium]